MDRKAEIRRLLKLSPEEVREQAGHHLVVCDHLDALHRRFAEDIAAEIRANNLKNKQTRLVLPVGPTGQYPILAEIINSEKISLSECWFFFMDENCGEYGKALGREHPLSFKGQADRLFLSRLDESRRLQSECVIFPDENNISTLAARIDELGGIDTCYGGIGIHGHVAFNEPEPGVKDTGPRRVTLNDFTVTINAVRSHVGGNLECFPRQAFTLGMKQILASRRIRLYCRNGCEFDWANTVLRLALFGTPGDDYPVTYVRDTDFTITTDRQTLASPTYLI
jgi:glucosamine-6-phosphate deaminase